MASSSCVSLLIAVVFSAAANGRQLPSQTIPDFVGPAVQSSGQGPSIDDRAGASHMLRNSWEESYSTAELYYEREQLTRAALAYSVAAERAESFASSDPRKVKTLLKWGLTLRQLGDLGASERVFEQALDQAQVGFGPASIEAAKALNNLALLQTDRQNYSKAETQFKKALIAAEAQGAENGFEKGMVLANLAATFLLEGRIQEAQPLLTRAVAILKSFASTSAFEVSAVVNNLARLKETNQQFAEADSLYCLSISILADRWPHDPKLAVLLKNRAALLTSLHRYQEAEELFRRAIQLLDRTPGQQFPTRAEIIVEYAQMLRKGHRKREARRLEHIAEMENKVHVSSGSGLLVDIHSLRAGHPAKP